MTLILAVCLIWNHASVYPLNLAAITALIVLYGLALASNLFGLRSLADWIVGTAVVSKD